MIPSLTRHKILVLSLLLVLAATVLAAGCTDLDNEVHALLPNTSPDTNSTPEPIVIMVTDITPVLLDPSPALSESPTTLPETTVPVIVLPTGTLAPEFLTYSNTSYGFTIGYPSDWQVIESPVETGQDPGLPRGYREKIDVVEFYSPAIARCHHSECVNVQTELHVEVDPAPPTTDLDEYYVKDVSAMQHNYPIEISAHNTMFHIADVNAYRLDYRQKRDLIDIHAERIYAGVAGKVFVFTFHAHAPYSGEDDQYEKYSGSAEKMLKSFKPMITYKTL